MKMRTAFLSLLLALAPLSAPAVSIDATQLLPPPPADGSPAAKAERAELDQVVAARTPEMLAQATQDDAIENPTIYRAVIGEGFDLDKLPATSKMLTDVMREQRAAANRAKRFFQRARPWVAEPDLKTCGPRGIDWHSSYPSGHATMGYSTGVVLAALIPEKAQAILTRASGYAENRLVCGMHFRRDIVAGEVLGTAVAVTLMHDQAFKGEFDAAEAELKAAHLAQ
ncbi:MAG TPA: phosphatase PAP2 family protein [Rhizomicrobium sp.]|nr:phosphatase PAP2 family protein [Rhizomicrobium sp.]